MVPYDYFDTREEKRMFCSIVEAVFHHAEKNPTKLCIADETEKFTYERFLHSIMNTAQKLENAGIQKGDKVAVECTQDATFLIMGLACQFMGAVFIPLEKNASKERVDDIIGETEPKCFICRSEYEVSVTVLKQEKFCGKETAKGDRWMQFPNGEDVSEILYSTGTTGKAKGIVITNGNNVAIAENIVYGTEMKKDSIELIPMPLSHSHALRTCYANLVNGSSVVIMDGVMRVKKVFELMEAYHVTALDLAPSGANVLMKLAKKKIKEYSEKIDFIEIGSAVLEEELKEMLCQVFPKSRLYNFYGSTEAGRSCILDFNKVRGKRACIGKPTKNATFLITDQDRKEIQSSAENPGLLAIAGPMNMKEYFKAPQLTKQVVENGFIYTTDLGYMDADGYVYVLGRMDDVINYNGIKIAPEEIENQVNKFPGVKDSACVPLKDELSGQVPKVFVAVEDKERFDTTELLIYLTEVIDGNKVPKKIEVIDEIPRTTNGKLLRRKLREEM